MHVWVGGGVKALRFFQQCRLAQQQEWRWGSERLRVKARVIRNLRYKERNLIISKCHTSTLFYPIIMVYICKNDNLRIQQIVTITHILVWKLHEGKEAAV